MVKPPQRVVRCLGTAILSIVLCQCETERTVKSTRSSFSFDEAKWGGQGSSDGGELKSKFADKGYTIAEDGTIKADRPNLYAGETLRDSDSRFGTREAKLGNREAKTKEFKTPEYLKRQEFAGVKTARDGNLAARESDTGETGDREAGKLFKSQSKTSTELAVFETSADREAEEEFQTKEDRKTGSAYTDAPRATGVSRKAGYQDNISMTMDDVKKMLNLGSYARSAGISN